MSDVIVITEEAAQVEVTSSESQTVVVETATAATVEVQVAGIMNHLLLTNIGTNTHAQVDTHIANTSNPHSVTKTQVGLGNADNTSDANKPVSTATQTALNLKLNASAFVPAGSTKHVQFNDAGAWGSDAAFTWDKNTDTLTTGLAFIYGGDGSASFMDGAITIGPSAGSNKLNLVSDGSISNGDGAWSINSYGVANLIAVVGLSGINIDGGGSTGLYMSQADFRVADYGWETVNFTAGTPGAISFMGSSCGVDYVSSAGQFFASYVCNNSNTRVIDLNNTALIDTSGYDAVKWGASNRSLCAPTTGADVFTWSTTTLDVADNIDMVFGATNGTVLGTTTSQKISFWAATPIVRPGATTDLGTVLSNIGLRASGTAYPITTSGTVNLGSLTASKTVATDASKNLVSVTAPLVVSSSHATGLTAANSNLNTYTTPNDGTDRNFRVNMYILIASISGGAVGVEVTFTDYTNASRTIFSYMTGTTAPVSGSTGFYPSESFIIRCKPNTGIIFKSWVSGSPTMSYAAGCVIESLY